MNDELPRIQKTMPYTVSVKVSTASAKKFNSNVEV